ncbi:putative ribonuclease H domain, reverse transcriptase zinc-binding domain-containing protein [Arabidopsis thaliana]
MLTKRLAIGSTLVTRRIIDDPTCKRCCMEEETSDHLFFGCQHAQAIWRGTHIFHSAFFDPNLTLEDKINVILQSCNNKRQDSLTRQILLWTLWRIWKSRNLLFYQQRSSEWRKEAQQAVTDAYEWADQGTIENLTSNNRTEEPIHGWMKPDPGYIKCNYGYSYNQNGNIVKASWILRDSNEYYKEATQSTGHNCVNTLEAELQALLMAMQRVSGKGYTHVIFEGDNKQAVSLSNGKSHNFQVHNLIREIQV